MDVITTRIKRKNDTQNIVRNVMESVTKELPLSAMIINRKKSTVLENREKHVIKWMW